MSQTPRTAVPVRAKLAVTVGDSYERMMLIKVDRINVDTNSTGQSHLVLEGDVLSEEIS